MKNPYSVIKRRYITEKATLLESLKDMTGSKSLTACDKAKYVFVVDRKATKPEVAIALKEIYKDQSFSVEKINMINSKPKKTRARKGRPGVVSGFRKAIVTLKSGNVLQES